MSLVNILEQLENVDSELEKEASELEKQAAEEEAAGRILARGFMDELDKLAQLQASPPPKVGSGKVIKAPQPKVKPMTPPASALKLPERKPTVPPAPPVK